jgi:hypothetical protein
VLGVRVVEEGLTIKGDWKADIKEGQRLANVWRKLAR